MIQSYNYLIINVSMFTVEFWTGFMITIPRCRSIFNGPGSFLTHFVSIFNVKKWPQVNFEPGSKFFVTPENDMEMQMYCHVSLVNWTADSVNVKKVKEVKVSYIHMFLNWVISVVQQKLTITCLIKVHCLTTAWIQKNHWIVQLHPLERGIGQIDQWKRRFGNSRTSPKTEEYSWETRWLWNACYFTLDGKAWKTSIV